MRVQDNLFRANERILFPLFLSWHHFEGSVVPNWSYRIIVKLGPIKRRVHHGLRTLGVPSCHLGGVRWGVSKSAHLRLLKHIQVTLLFERLELGCTSWSVRNQLFRLIQRNQLSPMSRVILIVCGPWWKSMAVVDNHKTTLTFVRIECHLVVSVNPLRHFVLIAFVCQLFRYSDTVYIRLTVHINIYALELLILLILLYEINLIFVIAPFEVSKVFLFLVFF